MLKDVLGRSLKVGQLVVLVSGDNSPFKVVDISPAMAFNSPMGPMVRQVVKVVCEMNLVVVGEGAALNAFIICQPEDTPDGGKLIE